MKAKLARACVILAFSVTALIYAPASRTESPANVSPAHGPIAKSDDGTSVSPASLRQSNSQAGRLSRQRGKGVRKGGRPSPRAAGDGRGAPSRSSFAAAAGGGEPVTTRQGEVWNYYDAYQYWLQLRANPQKGINWSAYARAFSQRSRMAAVRFSSHNLTAATSPRWDFLGPKNLPVPYQQYYGEGVLSGRVNGVAFDPRDPKVIYLASAGGGFWRSTDGGKNWTCLSDRWENVKFSSVAVSPADPNFIIVGTGDYAGALGYGYGLMVTRDGGAHWSNVLRDELRWYSVSQILFDPDDPRIITVTAGRHPQNRGKVLRSADGGLTWSRTLTVAGMRLDWGNVQAGQKDSAGRRYYYAVGVLSGNKYARRGVRHEPLQCAPGELWRSANRGSTWVRLAGPPAGACMEIMDVAPSASAPRTVYLATHDYLEGAGHIWASPDAGDSWDDTTNNFPHHYDPADQDAYNWSQSGYDFYIRCSRHPVTGRDVIYVGLVDIAASTDGGRTWRSAGRSYRGDALTHNDQHALAVNPRDPNDMLVGNDGGVYRLTYDPSADTWSFRSDLNAGLGMTMFYRVAVDPSNPDRLLGGTQDNATPVSRGDLAAWLNKGEGDGGFCAINPRNPDLQYATSQFLSIYRTEDGWEHVRDITPKEAVTVQGQTTNRAWGPDNRGFIAPIALSPSDPGKLYAGTNYLWRWDEDRKSWSRRLGNQVLASGDGFVNFIAVAPGDPRRIYTGSNFGDLWMTTDGGDTWRRIDNVGLPGATPALPVTSIAVHPNNRDAVVVGFGGTEAYSHLWRCDNTRAEEPSWVPIGGSGMTALPFVPLNSVVIYPRGYETTYYVGTDVGVFLSNDGGATWANFGAPLGLPNVQVTDLHLLTPRRRLVAATFGRGAWGIDLPAGAEPTYLKPDAGSNFGRGRRAGRRR